MAGRPALAGCRLQGGGGPLRIESIGADPVVLTTGQTISVYDHHGSGDTTFMLTNIPLAALLRGQVLEGQDLRTCASLGDMAVEPTARRSHLEPTLLRRLKQAAAARGARRPLLQKHGGVDGGDYESGALVHMLVDHYAERVLLFGILHPADATGAFHSACPESREQELQVFLSLLECVPGGVPLLHYGEALPRWFTEAGHRHLATAQVEERFINLKKRLRGAAVYPGPVFSLADQVRHVLGVDPHREGEAGAAARWVAEGQLDRLTTKGRSDLLDLSRVLRELRSEKEAHGPVA